MPMFVPLLPAACVSCSGRGHTQTWVAVGLGSCIRDTCRYCDGTGRQQTLMKKPKKSDAEKLKARIRRHATVHVGDYEIPLIGVPRDAVEQKCDRCGALMTIAETIITETGFECVACATKPRKPKGSRKQG